jgi:hypothetical protein
VSVDPQTGQVTTAGTVPVSITREQRGDVIYITVIPR